MAAFVACKGGDKPVEREIARVSVGGRQIAYMCSAPGSGAAGCQYRFWARISGLGAEQRIELSTGPRADACTSARAVCKDERGRILTRTDGDATAVAIGGEQHDLAHHMFYLVPTVPRPIPWIDAPGVLSTQLSAMPTLDAMITSTLTRPGDVGHAPGTDGFWDALADPPRARAHLKEIEARMRTCDVPEEVVATVVAADAAAGKIACAAGHDR